MTYTGRAEEVQDEGNGNGSFRVTSVSQTDGLGRLASVCEVTSTTLLEGQNSGDKTPALCGQDINLKGFLTTYQYDALNNLTSATQGSVGSRLFYYDGLSRLIHAVNPESGATYYTYDCTGQAGDLCTRNRAAANQGYWGTNTITTYTHDALHRLTSTTYSNTDNSPTYSPSVTLNYDQATVSGMTLQKTIGRMSSATAVTGSTTATQVFSYDPMGRVLDNSQCVAAACSSQSAFQSMPYSYDLLGDTTSSALPTGVTITYGYDNAAHMTGVTSSLIDATHPSSLFSNTAYNALGQLITSGSGTVSSTTGLQETWGYDKRGRTLQYISNIGSSYGIYHLSKVSYAGNGNLLGPLIPSWAMFGTTRTTTSTGWPPRAK
jgi:YD repeat-containing protein